MSLTIDKDAGAIVASAVEWAAVTMSDDRRLWTRRAIETALQSAFIAGATRGMRQCIADTDKLLAIVPYPFTCSMCGQHITDGKPCGCGARKIGEPRPPRYHQNCPTCTCTERACVCEPRTVYGDGTLEIHPDRSAPAPLAVRADATLLADAVGTARAGDGTSPSALDVLRACKPSPALVLLLAKEATRAADAGAVDDAITMLSLALCARSAWIEGSAIRA